jgi:hypothetical protein
MASFHELVPFQLFGPNAGPRTGHEHREALSKGFARTSWNGTSLQAEEGHAPR